MGSSAGAASSSDKGKKSQRKGTAKESAAASSSLASLEQSRQTTPKQAKISKKSAEAEDIQKKRSRPALIRQLSHKNLGSKGGMTEKEDIARKHSALWECVKRRHDKYGGYIYTFRLRDEFDERLSPEKADAAIREKNKELSPAIERPVDFEIEAFDFSLSEDAWIHKLKSRIDFTNDTEGKMDKFMRNRFRIFREIAKLGYEVKTDSTGVYFSAPDREALLNRYQKLKETHPTLPDFDVVSSDGIASDIEYIEALSVCDAILSDGNEFMHDHLAHIIPTLHLLLILEMSQFSEEQSSLPPEGIGKPTYRQEKVRLGKMIVGAWGRIMTVKKAIENNPEILPPEDRAYYKKAFEQIETTLGLAVDTLSAAYSWDEDLYGMGTFRFQPSFFQDIGFIKGSWGYEDRFAQRRYGEDFLGVVTLEKVWTRMADFEKELRQLNN